MILACFMVSLSHLLAVYMLFVVSLVSWHCLAVYDRQKFFEENFDFVLMYFKIYVSAILKYVRESRPIW